MAVHAVHDELLADDGGRGGHLPVRRGAAPDGRAGAHREGAHDAVEVGDERDLVVDDRRELDQRPDGLAPDEPERRAQADVGLGLGAARVCAVHRPLQLRLEGADGHVRSVAPHDPAAERVVAALRDGGDQTASVREQNPRDSVRVRARSAAHHVDGRAGHTRAQVAVEDGEADPRTGAASGAASGPSAAREPRRAPGAWTARRACSSHSPAKQQGRRTTKPTPNRRITAG